jgi:hypothetical protein
MISFESYFSDFCNSSDYGLSCTIKDKPLYIIGSGGSIRDVNVKSIVKNNDTMTINRCWYYLQHIKGIEPTYNVTLDPTEFWGIFTETDILSKDIQKIPRDMIFFMHQTVYDVTAGKYNGKLKERAKQLKPMLRNFEKNGAKIIKVPNDINFDSRFLLGKGDPKFTNGTENKLSMLALPLAYKLGYKKVFLLGTDYNHKTGHWYRKPSDASEAKFRSFGPYTQHGAPDHAWAIMNYTILKKWNDLFKKRGGCITSLVPTNLTKIHNYLK